VNKHKLCQYLVDEFCLKKGKEINWGLEIKAAKKLVSMFPEPLFWQTLSRKVMPPATSLLIFHAKENLYELGKLHEEFVTLQLDLTPPPLQPLSKEKIGEDKEIPPQKPTNIFEFIRS